VRGTAGTRSLNGGGPRDLAVREAFFRYLGPVSFTGTPPALLAVRFALVATAHPQIIALAALWAARTARRVGPRRLLSCRIHPRRGTPALATAQPR
jgi:hypothetical protein